MLAPVPRCQLVGSRSTPPRWLGCRPGSRDGLIRVMYPCFQGAGGSCGGSWAPSEPALSSTLQYMSLVRCM